MSTILILYAKPVLLKPVTFHCQQSSVKNEHSGNVDNHKQEEVKKMSELQILSPNKAISEAHSL